MNDFIDSPPFPTFIPPLVICVVHAITKPFNTSNLVTNPFRRVLREVVDLLFGLVDIILRVADLQVAKHEIKMLYHTTFIERGRTFLPVHSAASSGKFSTRFSTRSFSPSHSSSLLLSVRSPSD
jgi:hypothetical protein